MDNQELDDNIDRFILDKMNESELLKFAELVGSDDELELKIKQRKLTLLALREVANDEIKKKLIDHEAKQYAKPKRTTLYYSIAASIAMLIVLSVSWYFIISSNNLSSFDFYEEGIVNLMSNNDNIQFHDGMNAFKLENYAKCIDIYSNLAPTDTINYYLGVSYYRVGNYQSALDQFTKVTDVESIFNDKANFRRITIEYKLGNKELALKKMHEVASSTNHPLSSQAASFLDKME